MLELVVASVALLIAVLALWLAASIARRAGFRGPVSVSAPWRWALRIQAPQIGSSSQDDTPALRVAFVANPTKEGVSELREAALRACAIRYLPQPLWLWTTEHDAGTDAAREALAAGADVVAAVGGDGTVRAVAEALTGTRASMGIVPMGTGNLLARNLDLPLGDTSALLRTVVEGDDLTIDVGYLDVERVHRDKHEADLPRRERNLFLVMAGAGIDAEMVAGADPGLKRRLGWLAYFFSAIRHLGDKRMTVSLRIDDGEAVTNQMRTVLLANAGRLPGGINLIPDASLTDGIMDVATLDARAGIVGWTDLFGTVVAQGAGITQSDALKAWRTSRIDHGKARRVEIDLASPQRAQVDGEELGRVRSMAGFIEPAALKVRVPSDS